MKLNKEEYQSVVKTVISNRNVFMGIAIVMVVLYHYNTGLSFQKLFYPGFLGVDIFLFFSGYGLCRSYETHSLLDFYKRRFIRILPMFLFLAIVKCSLYTATEGNLSLIDWICSLTTLSYWGVGGIFVDWYLCGLMLLYILFPILYVLPYLGGAILSVVLLTIAIAFNLDWTYQCLIERIPIFLVGIFCYRYDETKVMKDTLIWFMVAFMIMIPLLYKHIVHTYTLIYTLAPFIILCIGAVLRMRMANRELELLKILGKYSLEIYITNCIVMKLVSYKWMVMPSVMYWALIFLLTPIIIKMNQFFASRI